jgi:hypothetical protein
MTLLMDDKKERKKAQVKKNRFQQEIFNFIRLKRQEEQRVEDIKEALAPAPAQVSMPSEALSDKVASYRNRLTGQKRLSKERWNRFAGTSGGGARGL